MTPLFATASRLLRPYDIGGSELAFTKTSWEFGRTTMETKQITFYNPETDIAVEDARPAKNESSSSLKTKENVASLLKKRLTKGEEEARAKRHKERLEMDEEMLELLSRVISFID